MLTTRSTARPPQGGGPGHGLRGRARHQPRHHHRQRRAAVDLDASCRPAPAAAVGRRRLQPGLRRAGPGRRQPVRPVRPTPGADHRAARLRRRQRRRRAGHLGRRPRRDQVRDGRVRRADLPHDPVHHQQHLPRASRAGDSARHLGRGRRPRGRRGPVTGGALLEHFYWGSVFWALVPLALVTAVAAYLLVPESRDPRRPAARPARPRAVDRDAGHARPTRSSRRRPTAGRRRRPWAGSLAAACCWPPSWSASAVAAPDARRHAVPRPPLQRCQRRGDDHLLRAVRLHLPGHPVLPVRPRVRRAVDRRADPPGRAVDRGRLRGRCGAGAEDRDQDRGHHGAGAVRDRVPLDLDLDRARRTRP